MTKGISVLLNQFKEAQRELRKRLEAEGETLLMESFKEIFDKHQGLKVFAFIGYTPSFNDGEPCEHSSYSYTGDSYYLKTYYSGNGKYWNNSWDDREELTELFVENFEEFDDSDTDSDAVQPLLVNRSCETLSQATKDVADFEDAIEMVYGTNYKIIVRLESDGNVSLEQEDYDCGY